MNNSSTRMVPVSLGTLRNYLAENRPSSITVLPGMDNIYSPVRIDMVFQSMIISMAPNAVIISNEHGYIRIDNIINIYINNIDNCLGTSVVIEYAPNSMLSDKVYYINIILNK